MCRIAARAISQSEDATTMTEDQVARRARKGSTIVADISDVLDMEIPSWPQL
jgi:hypothetical protein